LLVHGDTGDEVDQSISSPSKSPVEHRAIIVLGQDAFQAGIRHLDRGHRLVDQLGCLALA
jgi:hypothetical protein